MPEDKKILCPDCEKEIADVHDDCPHCDYPIRFHNARSRVKALEKRQADAQAQEEEKQKKSKRRFGGVL